MIQEIKDQRQWNDFLLSQPTQAGIFLQSWQWGEFQAALGRKVWRLAVMEGRTRNTTEPGTEHHGNMVGVCGMVRQELPMGRSYLYAPRAPILDIRYLKFEKELADRIEEIARDEKSIFFRFEPISNIQYLISKSNSTISIQPKQTLIVDLSRSEDDLLAAMHEKTRYNIRLALRRGVEIRNSKLDIRIEFEEFWKLMQETARRDKFRTHSAEYYKQMLEILGNSKLETRNSKQISNIEYPISNDMHVRFHAAYHGNIMLAGAIVAYFGDTATYLHGASSYEDRALMGPYALHWHIMQNAKSEGYKFYDFWGIRASDGAIKRWSDKDPWAGMTRFKMGFASVTSPDQGVGSGHIVTYPGTFDLPLSRFWYSMYRVARRLL